MTVWPGVHPAGMTPFTDCTGRKLASSALLCLLIACSASSDDLPREDEIGGAQSIGGGNAGGPALGGAPPGGAPAGGATEGGAPAGGAPAASFAEDIFPIFLTAGCNNSPLVACGCDTVFCHGGGFSGGGQLFMMPDQGAEPGPSLAALMELGYVTPGQAEASPLYEHAVERLSVDFVSENGSLTAAIITPEDAELIGAWIDDGALP